MRILLWKKKNKYLNKGKIRKLNKKVIGQGTLYFSESLNCWVGQYFDNSGKRQTMKQKKNEKVGDFKTRFNNTLASIENGTYIGKSKETIVSLAQHYIETKHDDGITSDRSYTRELETLEQVKKTCKEFCNIPIQNVKIEHLEKAKTTMKIYKKTVIDKIWTLLNKVFKIACSPSRKILVYNIMSDETLKKPISNKKTEKVKPLSKQEFEKFNSILDNEERQHKYRNILKLHIVCGSRIGEILARSEDDYNKKEETFYIWNTLTQDKNYNIIWSEHTKTYNKLTGEDPGKRFLPTDNIIFNEISNIINEEKNKKIKSIKNIHNVLFWDYDNDAFVTPSQINSWLNRINKKYHICEGSLSTHRLRHNAITHWMELGMPMEVIQYLAGHIEGSDITSKVYIDTSFDFVKNTVSKIS